MKSYCVKQKKNRLNALNRVEQLFQKMAENIFGAHVQNVELKKLNLLRETKSAPSRRGHFGYSGINWG